MELNWRMYSKKADFFGIAKKYNIDPVVARVLRNREVVTDEEIRDFLYPDVKRAHDPAMMKDMEKAVNIIRQKISERKPIRIVSDYDVDGVMSNYILLDAMEKAGAEVSYEIPHRIHDGYGINERIIRKAYEDGVDTIITCDNGIAAFDAISMAKELGMTVVVTDHHEMPYIPYLKGGGEGACDGTREAAETDASDTETGIRIQSIVVGDKEYRRVPADAVVDIKQPDCEYPFKGICGAVVAFKFIQQLYKSMGINLDLDRYIPFAAIATVCDVMPLHDENRAYVKAGLELIRKTENIGLRELMRQTELDSAGEITAYMLGFVIGPCINAAGRLDTPVKALKLLRSPDRDEAERYAAELKSLNDRRKSMTEEGVKLAEEYIKENDMERLHVFIIYLPELHESLAGIVAGRIKEKYYRPTIVFTDSGEEGILKGSGRSIEGYNLHEALTSCSTFLEKFGGHELAAGVSVRVENLDKLSDIMNINEEIPEEALRQKLFIDVPMPMGYVYLQLVEQLNSLAPFGTGNERPVFAEKGVRVKSAAVIGKNKNVVKLKLISEGGKLCEGICFQGEDFINNIKLWFTEAECDKMLNGRENAVRLDMAYRPDINEYQGMRNLQFVVINYRKGQ